AAAGGLDDIFGGSTLGAPVSPAAQDFYEALNSNGLRLSLSPSSEGAGAVSITAKFENQSSSEISKLNLQVAVPKKS
ncbi:hypothetical protein AAULH_14021, partial [Lactobacillus helveticus MTCC 5463]